MKTARRFRIVPLVITGVALLRGVRIVPASAPAQSPADTEGILRTLVNGYSNHGQPLIPSLIEIAAVYHLPMGIEKVTPEALYKPIHVAPEKRTNLSSVLNLCIEQVPGFQWSVQQGAVDIYGPKERADRLNLFNYVVPTLEVKDGDLNTANGLLRMSVPDRAVLAYRKAEAPPPGKVYSVFGDSPGIGGLKSPPVDFEAHEETVRSILNRIVVLSKGQVFWIARVPPDHLSRSPNKGLWQLWRPSPWGDVISTLSPALSRPPNTVGTAQRQPQ